MTLMEQKADDFQRILTGDEPWCLVSIPWLVNGIRSLLDVPKGTMYNITFFTDIVLPSLIENIRLPALIKTLKG
jgi:hypothetical protein